MTNERKSLDEMLKKKDIATHKLNSRNYIRLKPCMQSKFFLSGVEHYFGLNNLGICDKVLLSIAYSADRRKEGNSIFDEVTGMLNSGKEEMLWISCADFNEENDKITVEVDESEKGDYTNPRKESVFNSLFAAACCIYGRGDYSLELIKQNEELLVEFPDRTMLIKTNKDSPEAFVEDAASAAIAYLSHGMLHEAFSLIEGIEKHIGFKTFNDGTMLTKNTEGLGDPLLAAAYYFCKRKNEGERLLRGIMSHIYDWMDPYKSSDLILEKGALIKSDRVDTTLYAQDSIALAIVYMAEEAQKT
jgi:hypothetical protein